MSQTSDFSDQSTYLSILTATPADEVKQFVETLLTALHDVDFHNVDFHNVDFHNVEVIRSRTGLAMLPFVDSVKGITFHLGETLLAEALVKVGNQQGYAACMGRDLEQAIAIAILDALIQSNEALAKTQQPAILQFVSAAAQMQQQLEIELLRKVESTRVELEVF